MKHHALNIENYNLKIGKMLHSQWPIFHFNPSVVVLSCIFMIFSTEPNLSIDITGEHIGILPSNIIFFLLLAINKTLLIFIALLARLL